MKKLLNALSAILVYALGAILVFLAVMVPFIVYGLGISLVIFVGVHVLRAMGVLN